MSTNLNQTSDLNQGSILKSGEGLDEKISWDLYFMSIAYMISMKSKDLSTKVGAVIVGEHNQICSTGYNGLPRKVMDLVSRYSEKEYKYSAANHAEENAILHCARSGIRIEGCTLYSQWMPCATCAKSIIQVGIKRVVYHAQFPGNDPKYYREWARSMGISLEILNEAGVKVDAVDGKILQVYGLYNSKRFDV